MKAWLSHLKQGSVFVVKLLHRADTIVEHTNLRRQTPARLSAEEAVHMMVNAPILGPTSDGKEPAYEIPRRQVYVQLSLREELAA